MALSNAVPSCSGPFSAVRHRDSAPDIITFKFHRITDGVGDEEEEPRSQAASNGAAPTPTPMSQGCMAETSAVCTPRFPKATATNFRNPCCRAVVESYSRCRGAPANGGEAARVSCAQHNHAKCEWRRAHFHFLPFVLLFHSALPLCAYKTAALASVLLLYFHNTIRPSQTNRK